MNISGTATTISVAGLIMLASCSSGPRSASLADLEAVTRNAVPYEAAATSQSADKLPQLHEQSTVSDYLAYAALNNPGLAAAFHRWQAAVEQVPQARALPDPMFTFRYFVVEQAMRDGNMRFASEVAQTFPWFGKIELRTDMAAQDAMAAWQRFESQRVDLFARVKDAWYECQYLGRAVAITEENLRQLNTIADIAAARYKTAGGTQADVLRVQVEAGKLENELRSLRDLQPATRARLNAALGRPADSPVPTGSLTGAAVAIDDDLLVGWMLRHNPDLKAMEHDVRREEASISLARKDYFPDITLGAEYDQMVDVAGVPSGDMMNPVALMLSVNIPVWHDKYAAGVRQAVARRHAAAKDRQEKANALTSDLKLAAYNLRNAQRKIDLYRDVLLPKATQALKSVQADYQGAKAVFADLIDSQRILLDFQLSYERAAADRQQALARVEAIVGKPLAELTPVATQPAVSTKPAAP